MSPVFAIGRESVQNPDVAVEGARVQVVEGTTLQRVLREMARTLLLALQLDIRTTG